jgi:hypothetical protein
MCREPHLEELRRCLMKVQNDWHSRTPTQRGRGIEEPVGNAIHVHHSDGQSGVNLVQRRTGGQREPCVFDQVREEAGSLPSLNRQPMNPRSIYDAARFVGGSLQGENVDLPARTCSG